MVTASTRSSRRKPNVQVNEQESSELSDDGQDSDPSPPPRKRARGKAGAGGQKAKKKGKTTQTPKLLEIPLDVMFEVSGFLHVETVELKESLGFVTRRSSTALNPKICCNCLERPRRLGGSS